jgi:uncharacterized protein
MEDYASLVSRIRAQGPLAIALSGGVDSSLVARASVDAGVDALAITIDGPLFSRHAISQATVVAQEIGIPHILVDTDFVPADSSPSRCRGCKAMMASTWLTVAHTNGFHRVADGVTAPDLGDGRQPGARASGEAGIWHPLAEVGMDEGTVRTVARTLGLSVWNAPSDACLASRIAFGEPVTREKLHRVEAAEAYLRSFIGDRIVRVRLHGDLARIEVSTDDMPVLMISCAAVVKRLKSLGFTYVTLDVQGYRSGSMHEGSIGSAHCDDASGEQRQHTASRTKRPSGRL